MTFVQSTLLLIVTILQKESSLIIKPETNPVAPACLNLPARHATRYTYAQHIATF